MPDRDAECLGGNYDQLASAGCAAYRTAKVTGDSDFYYKGKTFTDPGTPNAFLTTTAGLKSGARYTGYAAARVGKPFVMSYEECSAAAPFAAGAAAPAGPEASLAAVAGVVASGSTVGTGTAVALIVVGGAVFAYGAYQAYETCRVSKFVRRSIRFGLAFLGLYMILFVVIVMASVFSLPTWLVAAIIFVSFITFCFRMAFGPIPRPNRQIGEDL
ncbi:MAG: hypothetical protein ACR2HM_03435 [Acidimicrobiales bacterium]